MSTRGDLKAEILDDLERDEALDGDRVERAITAAIRFYQSRRFYFNESRDVTFDTVQGQWVYGFGTDIPTEFYKIDLVAREEDANDYRLCVRDYRDIELLNDGSATEGEPTSYGYINRALAFYPVPDKAYTIRLTGHVKIEAPASDGEPDNPWMVEAYELIRCRAKASLSLHAYQNAEMAAVMRVAENEALSALMSATMDRAGTGHIVPSQF